MLELVVSRLVAASLVVGALAGGAASAGAQDSASSAAPQKAAKKRTDRNVISRDDMLAGNYSSAYDAVAGLRSMWLRNRGASGQSDMSTVWVYVDNSRVGDVEALRSIQPRLVSALRYYDGPSATSRWGVGHTAGVIYVSTFKDGAPADQADTTRRKP